MSLRIDIQPGSRQAIYRQIVEQVRLAVSTGVAEAGSPLPSVRALAQQLVVNPNTIAKAYAELRTAGYVESRPGKGIFVAEQREILSRSERRHRLKKALDDFLHEALCEGFAHDEIRAEVERELQRRQTKKRGGSK